MESIEVEIKFKKPICRSCLSVTDDCHSLVNNVMARQALMDLTGIVVNLGDKLPQSICTDCLKLLNKFTEFRDRILKNNRILMENSVKNSIPRKSSSTKCYGQIMIKEELETTSEEQMKVWYLETPYNKEAAQSSKEETLYIMKPNLDTKIKKKAKQRKKEKQLSKRTPRVFIHVDPEKITVIKLSKEEQIRRQRAEAERAKYRNMPYKCLACYKGFNYERKLSTHIEKYHQVKAISKFKCNVCSRTMGNGASLALHMKKHELLYQCTLCEDSFVEKRRAILHYKSTHEGLHSQYPCKLCDKVLKNRSSLHGHVRNHHPQNEQPQCTICNKKFVTKDSYDDHVLIHRGEKNYACDICGARFRFPQNARAHLARHSDMRAYYCMPCDASFKSKSAYRHHLNTARAHVNQDVKAKNTCIKCGRQFSTKYGLQKHGATHERPGCGDSVRPMPRKVHPLINWVCHYCGRGFSARRILDNHILVHTGVRPHACSDCGHTFTQLGTLRTHVRRKHPDPHLNLAREECSVQKNCPQSQSTMESVSQSRNMSSPT